MGCRNHTQNWYIIELSEKDTQNWRDCRNQTQNRGSYIPVLDLWHLHPRARSRIENLEEDPEQVQDSFSDSLVDVSLTSKFPH